MSYGLPFLGIFVSFVSCSLKMGLLLGVSCRDLVGSEGSLAKSLLLCPKNGFSDRLSIGSGPESPTLKGLLGSKCFF